VNAPKKDITSISTYTHAKGLYIPFFAKFSFFNLFFVPLRVSSIYASTANSFSSAKLTIQTDNPEEADIGFSLLGLPVVNGKKTTLLPS
jgi:hypothetical protein